MKARQKSVLIIDDQPDERIVQRAMLSHLGYTVSEASGGEEGIGAATEVVPDLVLLDVAMPTMDGFTVCRELRADPRTRRVRVILFTASVAADLQAQAEAAGADSLLIKPLDPRHVAAEVQRLIGPAQS